MPHRLKAVLPDPATLISLAPEELAGILLPIIKQGRNLSLYNFVNDLNQMNEVYPRASVPAISKMIAEA